MEKKTIIFIIIFLLIVLAANTLFILKPFSNANSKCLEKYNLTKGEIIFYYADELHSNNMKPIVNELSGQYGFYWMNNSYDSEFNECSGYNEMSIPAFVCVGKNKSIIGEVSKENLEAFAKACS